MAKIIEFKKIEVWPAIKIGAAIGLILGLIFTVLLAILASAIPELLATDILGPLQLAILPLRTAIELAIITALSVLIYNLLAKYIGGIRVQT